jgi:hypothetical protein
VSALHGLLVVFAIAKDFDTALRHGSLALAAARTDEHRFELLLNLASVCYDVGRFRSSLHGYLQVIARGRLDRLPFPHSRRRGRRAASETGSIHLAGAASSDAWRDRIRIADMMREFASLLLFGGR